MTEDEFITIITIIAENHNCKVKEIDFIAKTFQIACPKGNEVMCAAELEEMLKDCCINDIETLEGWPI